MFTASEKAYLQAAVDMSIASNKRAKNTSKNPQYGEMYSRIGNDLIALSAKIANIKAVPENNK